MNEPHWLDEPEQQAWRAYIDSTRTVFKALDRQLIAEAGITFTDYEVLVRLSEAPGRQLRMGELAEQALSTRSGMTRAVTRAEKLGWVRRVECETDRRGTIAELTDEGMVMLVRTAPGHVEAVRQNLIDLLSADQLLAMRDVGRTVLAKLTGDPG
jgi:DNA-binding MarR family transcriptional regulator